MDLSVSRPSRTFVARGLATIVLINLAVGVVIGGGNMKAITSDDEHREILREAIAGIPKEASLITQNDIYPHVATRPNSSFIVSTYDFAQFERAYGKRTPEYILYDTELSGFWSGIVIESFRDRLGDQYGAYRYEDGVWVFKRGYDGPARAITSDARIPTFEGPTERYTQGEFRVGYAERADDYIVSTEGDPGQILWYGPYEIYPPGTYNVTYQVYVGGSDESSAAKLDVVAGPNHQVVAQKTIGATDGWENVSLTVTFDRPQSNVEFRGFRLAEDPTIALRQVTVTAVNESGDSGDSGGGSANADRDSLKGAQSLA
jgi:hypothetical protein